MKNQIIEVRIIFSILMLSSWFFNCIDTAYAQNIKWLRIGDLQAPINETGAEYEAEFAVPSSTNYFSWPAQYGINQ
jgi:hypothetical protein